MSNAEKPTLTIFTPTYNRGYILPKLFASLQAQTCRDFEWIVIDDGSSDGTEDFFETRVKSTADFPVTYRKKQNGGKHRAINEAVKLARGELFFIVDSDDRLTDTAVEKILEWRKQIAGLQGFAGVAGNCGRDENHLWGTTFSGDWVDCTSLERSRYQITGDKAEVFYTEILRRYPFPEFQGENFLTESIVWNRIAEDGWKLRWFNHVIYLADYLEDGLTKNLEKINRKNPQGYALNLKQNIRHGAYSRRDKINIYYRYYTVTRQTTSLRMAAQYLEIPAFFLLYIVVRCRLRDGMRKLCQFDHRSAV